MVYDFTHTKIVCTPYQDGWCTTCGLNWVLTKYGAFVSRPENITRRARFYATKSIPSRNGPRSIRVRSEYVQCSDDPFKTASTQCHTCRSHYECARATGIQNNCG